MLKLCGLSTQTEIFVFSTCKIQVENASQVWCGCFLVLNEVIFYVEIQRSHGRRKLELWLCTSNKNLILCVVLTQSVLCMWLIYIIKINSLPVCIILIFHFGITTTRGHATEWAYQICWNVGNVFTFCHFKIKTCLKGAKKAKSKLNSMNWCAKS